MEEKTSEPSSRTELKTLEPSPNANENITTIKPDTDSVEPSSNKDHAVQVKTVPNSEYLKIEPDTKPECLKMERDTKQECLKIERDTKQECLKIEQNAKQNTPDETDNTAVIGLNLETVQWVKVESLLEEEDTTLDQEDNIPFDSDEETVVKSKMFLQQIYGTEKLSVNSDDEIGDKETPFDNEQDKASVASEKTKEYTHRESETINKEIVIIAPSSPATKAHVLSTLIQDKAIVPSTPAKSKIAVLKKVNSDLTFIPSGTKTRSTTITKTKTSQSLIKSGIPIREKLRATTPELTKRHSEQMLNTNRTSVLTKRRSEPLLSSSATSSRKSSTSSLNTIGRKPCVPSRYYQKSLSYIQKTNRSGSTNSLSTVLDDEVFQDDLEATGISLVLAVPVDGDPQSLATASAESTRSFSIAPFGQTYTLKARCKTSGIYRYMKLII